MKVINRTTLFDEHFNQRANVHIKQLFRQKLAVFKKNPYDPSLNNHALKHNLTGLRSWSLTDDNGSDDFRVLYKAERNGDCSFIDFGTHNQIYRSWLKVHTYWFGEK